jgi:hypothetical protein
MGEPQGNNYRELIYRVGTFFLLVGTGLLIFFMLSESAGQPMFNYFCGSIVLLVVGFMFRAQYKKSAPSSGRFSVLNRFKRKPKEEKKL